MLPLLILTVQVVAIRIDTGLMGSVLFIVFFHQKLSTFGAFQSQGFKMGNKIAGGVIGTTVKGLTSALGSPLYDIPVASGTGTFCQGNRTGVMTFGEPRTG
jgi:hypothetical protein